MSRLDIILHFTWILSIKTWRDPDSSPDDYPPTLAWNYCGMFYDFTVNTTYGEHLKYFL